MVARTFLFLQGLASPFMFRLAQRLQAAGHGVRRINVSGADLVFWRAPAINFRGRSSEWPAFLENAMRDHGVTDIVLFGDCRPLHQVAIAIAGKAAVSTHLLEEGYFRPNWITYEKTGINGFSTMPRDPGSIAELARSLPEMEKPVSIHGSFARRAIWDVAANIVGAVLWPVFPHYKWHGTEHPFVEYLGWLRKFARTGIERRRSDETLRRVVGAGLSYYVFPLQLHSDYQIRVHSSYSDAIVPVEETIASFARAAPPDTHLLFKLHPLDNSLFRYPGKIAALAQRNGLSGRVHVVDGGDLSTLLKRSRGVVLVNSSVGASAVEYGCAVKALGQALYAMPGLTFQGSLDEFWTASAKPDPVLFQAYRRVVMALTQVNGGFFDTMAIELGTRNMATRILARAETRRPDAV